MDRSMKFKDCLRDWGILGIIVIFFIVGVGYNHGHKVGWFAYSDSRHESDIKLIEDYNSRYSKEDVEEGIEKAIKEYVRQKQIEKDWDWIPLPDYTREEVEIALDYGMYYYECELRCSGDILAREATPNNFNWNLLTYDLWDECGYNFEQNTTIFAYSEGEARQRFLALYPELPKGTVVDCWGAHKHL